jgi:Ni/Fe-hydrogenase subunit HybB-like protein
MSFSPAVAASRGRLYLAALLSLAAGALYRIDVYLTMYRPAGWIDGVAIPSGWNYFPSLGETVVTMGAIAFGLAVFIGLSRFFPVVVREDAAPPASSRPPTAQPAGNP